MRSSHSRIHIVAFIVLLSVAWDAHGANWYVDVNNPGGGTGANDPFGNIRDAVSAASGSDSIFIADGIYGDVAEQFSTFGEIVVSSSLNFMGGYTGVTGVGTSDWTAAGRTSRTSVVDLNGTTSRAFNATNAKQAVFDGFTFQNANNTANGSVITMGGSFDRGGTIRDSLFQDNVTTGQGGAVAVSSNNDPVLIENVDFINNRAGSGGALRVDGNNSVVTLRNSSLTNNTATDDGGAIFATGGNASLVIVGTDISDNTAADEGGALYNTTANTTVRQSTITNNVAGGASAIGSPGFDGGTLHVENTLIADNTSTDGTGYVIDMRTDRTTDVTLHFVTLANNDGAGAVASLASNGSQTANLEILNSILFGDGTGTGILAEDNIILDYNDVINFATLYNGASAGANSVSVDPQFVDAANGDYRLLSTSDLLVLASDLGISVDLLAESRPQDGGFTIGAFEAGFVVQNTAVPEPGSLGMWLVFAMLAGAVVVHRHRWRSQTS